MSSEDEFLLMPWGLPEGPAHHRRTPAAVHGAMIALELAKDSEEKRERERDVYLFNHTKQIGPRTSPSFETTALDLN